MPIQTLPEWEAYVGQLSGADLWSKTIAMNTQRFADSHLANGGHIDEVPQILGLFVRRILQTEGKLPEGGTFNLAHMATQEARLRPLGDA